MNRLCFKKKCFPA